MSNGNKKHGRTKNSPAQKRYVAEGRLAVNKKRRIAREERRQSALRATAEARVAKRRIGALRRLDRRIKAAQNKPDTLNRLLAIRIKVAAAASQPEQRAA